MEYSTISLDRLRRLAAYPRIFASLDSMRQFRRLRAAGAALRGQPPITLRLRALGGHQVICRPGTTDGKVLWDTFAQCYHLPSPQLLHAPRCIIDLGANVGYTAAHFAHLYPEAHIIAVEMDPSNALAARSNLAPWASRCTLIQAAIWNHDGEIVYDGEEEWGFSATSDASPITLPDGHSRTAPARTLLSILDKFSLAQVDYMKVDIEGAERQLLESICDWAPRVVCLKLEFHPPVEGDWCRRMLEAAGYRVTPDTSHPRSLLANR